MPTITELIGHNLHVSNTQIPEVDENGAPVSDGAGGVALIPGKQLTFMDQVTGDAIRVRIPDDAARALATALLGSGIVIPSAADVVQH